MRGKAYRAAVLVLAVLHIAPVPAFGCPPSKTWTTGPDGQAGFVLAEGALAAIRAAGPFEVPWDALAGRLVSGNRAARPAATRSPQN